MDKQFVTRSHEFNATHAACDILPTTHLKHYEEEFKLIKSGVNMVNQQRDSAI